MEDEKEKIKINVNNPSDLRKLRKMQADRGAKYVNQGRQKALNTAKEIMTPIGLGLAIGTGLAYPMATLGGLAGSYVGSNIGEKIAGKEGEVIGGFVGGLPGSIAGNMYGNWVRNNYNQLGRYTLNNLEPAGYFRGWKDALNKGKALFNIWTQPLYRKPPQFMNGVKPKWHRGTIADETRFQNGAIWARISDDEIPKNLIMRNADGVTYRPTREAIEGNFYGKEGAKTLGLNEQKTINLAKKQGKIDRQDQFSTLGGEHSEYSVLSEGPQGVLWQQTDVQQLNPQWLLTDPIKRIFPVGSAPYNFFHNIGGKNISGMLGYKPFTYKLGIGVTKENVKPEGLFYFDPTDNVLIPE